MSKRHYYSQFLLNFQRWCDHRNHALPQALVTLLDELESSFASNDAPRKQVEELCTLLNEDVRPLIEEFRRDGRVASPTFMLWDDVLFRVLLPLKIFIAATRDGLWEVQQSAKSELLPLLFATNRTNYARYMPVQLLAMRRLPREVQQQFSNGRFSINLSEGAFKGVWLDYAQRTRI